MQTTSKIRTIAFLGNYLPRQCGIATFTSDLLTAAAAKFPGRQCFAVPVNDVEGGYDYPPQVRLEIEDQDLSSYRPRWIFWLFREPLQACVNQKFRWNP